MDVGVARTDMNGLEGCLLSRNPVHVRDATCDDVEALLEIWADFSVRPYVERFPLMLPEVEAAAALARTEADPDERLIVGVVDGEVVGAAHLRRASMSPIHSESAIHVSHLQVLDEFRRRGVGRTLIEAAVTWAEDENSSHVIAAASANSRDANRFMAQLGLAPLAMARGATVGVLRAKLPVEPPAAAWVGARSHRSVGQVLAQRRSLRRARTRPI